MHLICISRGSQSRGAEFAEKLGSKLGYECVSREQLLEEATKARIPIGKLETAIIKPHIFTERLALELEHYKALATSILCEKALDHDLIYHGRTGHLLLPGIEHTLRIRVVSDLEHRMQVVMRELGLPWNKAKHYIEQIDEDRRRWVSKFYAVEWDLSTLYDLVLNLSQLGADNAASAACSMAMLPEFQATPASIKSLNDLHLAALARLALASDHRTARANIKVRTSDRVIYVTYLSQEVRDPEVILEVLSGLTEAREVVCTRAQTNILWIQEDFSSLGSSYGEVLSLANTWDAAVELVKVMPDAEQEERPVSTTSVTGPVDESWRETGIFDEDSEPESLESKDISQTYRDLISDGRAGGKRIVQGDQRKIIAAIDRSVEYRLVVLDNVFLDKGTDTRRRMRQEWSNSISDSLKVPVVTIDEIVARYHFGVKQAIRMCIFAVITAAIVLTVFFFDDRILQFLSGSDLITKILAMVSILIFVPVFAFIYSRFTHQFLVMIRLD